jgi:UDP-N-acetyl-D-glucosamine dehydrogenase
MASEAKLAVIGQGYVGLPLAMLAVEVGHHVVGVDLDSSRVERLRQGNSYVDDVDDTRLRAALDSGRYTASVDYADTAGFAVAVITVPTPLRDRSPDLSFVADAARALAPHLTRGSTVVLESTTYPGTTEELLRPILEQGSGLTASLEAVREFYGKLVADLVPVSSTRAAELTKLLENTFRHVNIALVNEFAIFARELNVDVWEVVRAASTKPFGFLPFYPGPGVGGHCLPIDPTYLSWHVQQATGRRFRFVELANDINEHMPDHVVQRVVQGLNRLGKPARGSTILLLGLAYKKNSSDARESPATRVARSLISLGARVGAVDEHVSPDHLAAEAPRVRLTPDLLRSADAVVVLTDHDDIDYGLVRCEARWILDCRDRMSGANVESL